MGYVQQPKTSAGDGFTAPFTPHGLRHTFVSVATAAGVNPYKVKALVNHALPKGDITAGYIRFGPDDLRPDVERITGEILAIVGEAPGRARSSSWRSGGPVKRTAFGDHAPRARSPRLRTVL